VKIIPATFLLAALFTAPAALVADEAKAPGGLLEIVARLESEGYGPITEISFEKGRWEVEGYKDDTAYKSLIDPATGRTLAQRRHHGDPKPPANAKKLSEILKSLEAQGYAQIAEVSFEKSHWEIQVYRDRAKRELRVDPVSGRVVSDRADD
jgi:uncharacterized membrane protein YkoI